MLCGLLLVSRVERWAAAGVEMGSLGLRDLEGLCLSAEVVGTRGGGAVGGGAGDPHAVLACSSVSNDRGVDALSMSSTGEGLLKLLFELYEKKQHENN